MDVKFEDNNVTINMPERGINEIVVSLAIESPRTVRVQGFANVPEWIDIDVRADRERVWEVDNVESMRGYSASAEVVRTVAAVLVLAVDEWATAERFAQFALDAAEAKAAEAQAAAEKAASDLAAARSALDKARSGR